jgi:hypothetical protein
LDKAGFTSIQIGKAEINILLYADDMIVLAYNCFDLQTKINVFMLNDLHVNLNKTKIVIFRQGNARRNKPKILWGEHEIEIVDSYTYLGVPFYGKMTYSKTADHFITKGKQTKRELFNLFFKAKIYNLDVKFSLFVVHSVQLNHYSTFFLCAQRMQ